MSKHLRIAVDGYSSCGKSTLAKDMAQSLRILYIDSGAMYRAVTLAMIERGISDPNSLSNDAIQRLLTEHVIEFRTERPGALPRVFLDGRDVSREIRTPRVAALVSVVATLAPVREHLVALQRRMSRDQDVVMDGRDIGTVVFPDAEVKIFVTARPEVRAQRRFLEHQNLSIPTTFEEVLENLTRRDEIDRNRAHSPLRQAEDAVVIDNSDLTREEQLELALRLVAEHRGQKS